MRALSLKVSSGEGVGVGVGATKGLSPTER